MTGHAPNPDCLVCRGRGWYEAPYYGNLEPTLTFQPCPDCNPVEPMGVTGCALVVALFAGFIALLAWGF